MYLMHTILFSGGACNVKYIAATHLISSEDVAITTDAYGATKVKAEVGSEVNEVIHCSVVDVHKRALREKGGEVELRQEVSVIADCTVPLHFHCQSRRCKVV